MNTVGVIPGYADPYYYHFLFEGKVVSAIHSGTESQLKRKIELLRVDAIVDMMCQFKKLDDQVIDSRKNIPAHKEHRDKIQGYIDWSFKNRDGNTLTAIGFGLKVAKNHMMPILGLIQDDQPLKKDLVSLISCIIETSK